MKRTSWIMLFVGLFIGGLVGGVSGFLLNSYVSRENPETMEQIRAEQERMDDFERMLEDLADRPPSQRQQADEEEDPAAGLTEEELRAITGEAPPQQSPDEEEDPAAGLTEEELRAIEGRAPEDDGDAD